MYKQGGKRKLGRTASHRRSLIHNQLRSLFRVGYVSTTSQKAKVLKANADSLINKVANSEDKLVLVRELHSLFKDEKLVGKVTQYAGKESSGVRIVKIGFRSGDNAEVSKVTLIDFVEKKKVGAKKKSAKKDDKAAAKSADQSKPAEAKRGLGDKIAKSIKSKMPVSKERARSRSGL